MIRIVSGKPGKGKTLFLTYLMYLSASVNGYENYLKSCKRIKFFNEHGYKFSYPLQKHVTYFNGQARIAPMGRPVKNIFTFNPWEMALPTKENDVALFFPYSDIFVDEGQRYYNSRLFQKFPAAVSRFYELHRHYGLNITIACQRPGLIDLNIRELAEELIYIEDLDTIVDELGNLIKATWHIRKFTNNAEMEKYIDGHKDLGTEEIVECEENLFKFYNTKFFEFAFLNQRENQDFLNKCLKPFEFSPEIVNVLNEVYSFNPPPNYYDNDKREDKT